MAVKWRFYGNQQTLPLFAWKNSATLTPGCPAAYDWHALCWWSHFKGPQSSEHASRSRKTIFKANSLSLLVPRLMRVC